MKTAKEITDRIFEVVEENVKLQQEVDRVTEELEALKKENQTLKADSLMQGRENDNLRKYAEAVRRYR